MRPSILVIALVPPEEFSHFLEELEQRYPGAAVTALVGSTDLEVTSGAADPPEYLRWGAFGGRALLAEVRRRRFDLLALPYTTDYCHRLTYWKALALAAGSRARGLLFCEQARLPERATPLARLTRPLTRAGAVLSAVLLRGLPRVVAHLLAELLILLLGSLLLVVLLAIALVDGTEALLGLFGRGRRNAHGPRGS